MPYAIHKIYSPVLFSLYTYTSGHHYLDIYHVFFSKIANGEIHDIIIPEDVVVRHMHPSGKKLVQFANRIDIQHHISIEELDVEGLDIPDTIIIDANERFVTISASDGLMDDSGKRKSGPGIIVIDLDEHGSSLYKMN